MMAFALLQLGGPWFAVRRAQAWGVWAGLLANEAVVPYYLAVSASFAQRGAPILGGLEFILVITAVTGSSPALLVGGDPGGPPPPSPVAFGEGRPLRPAGRPAPRRTPPGEGP